MAISGVRQGAAVKIAAVFQTAQGTPVTTFVDADLLRADEAPAPDPSVEIISQTGSHGSPYERDEGVALVGITPTVEATVKVSRESSKLFLESLLGFPPVVAAGFSTFEGFANSIPKFLTYLWDSTFEAIRAEDVWIHTIEFRSFSSENLVMTINGEGRNLVKVASVLSPRSLINFDTYSHKDSTLTDDTGATVNLLAMEQTFRIEHGFISVRGNTVAPNFLGKDGMNVISGTFRTRLYDDTIAFFDRMLALTRVTLKLSYVQQGGKTLVIDINNATVVAPIPRRNADGTLDDLVVTWTARQLGGPTPVFPFKVTIED